MSPNGDPLIEAGRWLDEKLGGAPIPRLLLVVGLGEGHLLDVLETRLTGRPWVMDDYSIADISMLGWVRNLVGFYEARDLVKFDELTHVPRWLERGLERPAVQRGLQIPKRG